MPDSTVLAEAVKAAIVGHYVNDCPIEVKRRMFPELASNAARMRAATEDRKRQRQEDHHSNIIQN
eukprot:3843024-Pyramimonas_sp.AAC.1